MMTLVAAAPGAKAAPAAAPLTAVEVVAHVHALAVKKLAALSASFPPLVPENTNDLPALGPCERPNAARRAAIATTVTSWIRGQPDTHDAEEPLEMRVGCDEAAGVVVNAQADVLTANHHQGHWWILRIKDQAVDMLAHDSGLAANDVGEWMNETMLHCIGLADLDRDGILDVITELDRHEGGSPAHHVVLSSIASRTHRMIKIAEFGDRVELVRGQHPHAGDPVVVSIYDHSNYRHRADSFYRCLDLRPALFRCAATRAAKQFDVAWTVARGWSESRAPTVPDRDTLAEDLAALDAPADEGARLLASAPATDPKVALLRRIGRATILDDDRTNTERDTAQRAEAAAWNARLRDTLGDKPCSLTAADGSRAPQDRLRAWADRHTPTGDGRCTPHAGCQPATLFEIKGGCTTARGSYYELGWGPSQSSYGLHRHALVFVAGDTITPLRDLVVTGDTAPDPAAGDPVDLGFAVAFSRKRKGDAAVAIILEHTGATAVIDGTVAGTVAGEPTAYEVGGGIRSEVLFTVGNGERVEYWHVGRRLEQLGSMAWSVNAPAPDGALPRMLVDREITNRARAWLNGTDWSSPDAVHQLRDPGLRAALVAALTILKADRSLIDAVKPEL